MVTALEYAGFVLVHAAALADSNRHGELVCPFAVISNEQGRRVAYFEAESQQEALARGWDSLDASRARQEAWGFAREGFYKENNALVDVLLVSSWTAGLTDPISVMQRFARGSEQELSLFGPTELLVDGPSGPVLETHWDQTALDRGIASHPRAASWSIWRSGMRPAKSS